MDMFDRKLHDPYHTELPYYIKFSTRETLNYELLYSLGLLAPMHSCCIRLVSVVFDAVETVIDMSVLILSRHVQIQHMYMPFYIVSLNNLSMDPHMTNVHSGNQ